MDKAVLVTINKKGQITIPQQVRKELKLDENDTLAMIVTNGAIIMRKIEAPTATEMTRDLTSL